MRLHRLTVTAFGPYAGTETVDFDELNESGVFLMTGPTGAGKTSLLDAVCFAFYGVVPGVRDVRSLRSHHAPSGSRPEVVLEATLGERRYRITRSPEWLREKRRGTGFTKENASATLVEIADGGTERLVTSRIAEVGHELCLALGMRSEQFMQVVLLPQGEFQTFLRASSDERQGVLERLFHTQRFARIEDWMRDHTRELSNRAGHGERRVSHLLATIGHRSRAEPPEPLATAMASDRLGDVASAAAAWSASLLTLAEDQLTRRVAEERAAQQQEQDAAAAHDLALRRDAARRSRAAAQSALDEIEADSTAESAAQALDRHQAAARLTPLLAPLRQLDLDVRRAAERRAAALAPVCTVAEELGLETRGRKTLDVETLDRGDLEAARAALAGRLGRLSGLVTREEALTDARSVLAATGEELVDHQGALEAVAERITAIPSEHERLVVRVTDARAAAALWEGAQLRWQDSLVRLDAATAFPAARHEHDSLRAQHADARDHASDARARHLDVVEQRLLGMAAELAGQLDEGQPCAVCGSHEHPDPATAEAGAVTEADQRRAAHDHERLQVAAESLRTQLQESAQRVRRLEELSAGQDIAEATQVVGRHRAQVEAGEAAAGVLPGLEATLAALEAESQTLAEQRERVQLDVARTVARIAAMKSTVAAHEADITDALGVQQGSVAEAVARCESLRDEVGTALEALTVHAAAEARRQECASRADEACVELGFSSATEARAALLSAEEAESLRRAVVEREERRRRALAVVDDQELKALAEAPGPDLPGARSALAVAHKEHRELLADLGAAQASTAALRSLSTELEEALREWEPDRRRHDTAEGMSRLVRGMGSDNQLQMRLSSYVLATRLDQVLDAANERLSHMREQRYTLRRCGTVRGNARAGLGLEVLDDWTGEARSPSTLSGGETFVVSLALALGLADVVAHESGGLRVDTLFIDEGFGMLDADTLDDVMDRIDALRAGGRTVGVVSHVTELRNRIPTQVHINIGREGSTVEVRTLVA